jgi:L-alanine-DL-glutamate epimerase-like enolase superfamily enzyme
MRALSAIDIALWDILGKAANQPVYQLLGGKVRDRIRTYNTCYDNEYNFATDADKLARSLLRMGIRAMKIATFDEAARENKGNFITREQMNRALEPVRKIREAVGDEMGIMMEFHGLWNLTTAVEIAKALEPYNMTWLEEMIPQDNLDAYRVLRERVSQPLTISERLFGRWQYADLLKKDAASFVMMDLAWGGGITEARKVAILADTHYLPLVPHNCGGPIFQAANLHLSAHIPNLYILESVRRHYQDEFPHIVTNVMTPGLDGSFPLPEGPGLGIELKPEMLERADVMGSESKGTSRTTGGFRRSIWGPAQKKRASKGTRTKRNRAR